VLNSNLVQGLSDLLPCEWLGTGVDAFEDVELDVLWRARADDVYRDLRLLQPPLEVARELAKLEAIELREEFEAPQLHRFVHCKLLDSGQALQSVHNHPLIVLCTVDVECGQRDPNEDRLNESAPRPGGPDFVPLKGRVQVDFAVSHPFHHQV
jgi:hypothetical protein